MDPNAVNGQALLAYIADLELEVDRLRKQSQFVQQEVRTQLKRIQLLCTDAGKAGNQTPVLSQIEETVKQLSSLLHDMQETGGYHPAHDQVVAISVGQPQPHAMVAFRS